MSDFIREYQQTPKWLEKKLHRRKVLKAAAGATAVAMSPVWAVASAQSAERFKKALEGDDWSSLDAVLNHLLPSSDSGPGSKELQASYYLFLLVNEQPTPQPEKDFIFRGLGWLEGYTQKRHQKPFHQLNTEQKQATLTGINRSQAGQNWLNMLIMNIYEAMLAPPSYGGNPDGVGWKWLNHPMGFPLPPKGKRYFELPPRTTYGGNAEQNQTAYIQEINKSAGDRTGEIKQVQDKQIKVKQVKA